MIGRRGFLGALAAIAALPRLPEPSRVVRADLWRSVDGGAPVHLRGITDDGTYPANLIHAEIRRAFRETARAADNFTLGGR